jgi:hypothetical protein
MLHTALTERFGTRFPILGAPVGPLPASDGGRRPFDGLMATRPIGAHLPGD